MNDGPKSKKEKTLERVKKQQKIIEALKYHHEPSRKSLEGTKAAGGYGEGDGQGLHEDLHSQVAETLTNLRSNLHTSRERARKRGRAVFRGR